MDSQQFYFKVPFSDDIKQENKLHIIGVIDCSGSMGSWWKNLAEFWNSDCIPKQNCVTITFDTSAKIVPGNMLNSNINHHGGGGTNISEPFIMFEKEVDNIPKDHSITAIFISDGQDNNLQTLDARMKKLKGNQYKKINFICLGIEKGFPTFISMNLRQLYHKGDDTIPALYLIEYASDKAFFNKFEGMKKYFYSSGTVQLDPPVCIYIWDESVVESAYEGAWVISKSEKQQVGQKIYDTTKTELNVQDLVDIFRGWVQSLQLTALNNMNEAQKNATIALKEMEKLTDQLSQKLKIDIKNIEVEQENAKNSSFYKRSTYNFVFRYGNKIGWFLNEVKALAQGKNPKFENEFEAAKRMNIGTITGKYHQKALALKAITPDEFELIKQEFITLFNKTKIFKQEDNEGEQIIEEDQQKQKDNKIDIPKNAQKYKNIRDVFNEPDFLKAFDFLKNPYDLFETFPLQGLAIKLKRFEGANENPWNIEVKFIPKQAAFFDLTELTKGLFNVQMTFNNDHKEDINCILPLFNEKQQDLQPYLTTRFFKLMMSYVVMQNADILCNDAYLSLLTSTVAYLFRQKVSEWRNKMLSVCFTSLKICYSQEQAFQTFTQLLIDNPLAALNESEKVQIEEEKKNDDKQVVNLIDLGKPFIHSLYIQGEGLLDKEKFAQLFQLIFLHYFRQLLAKVNFFNIVKPDISEKVLEEIKNNFVKSLDKYFSISEFRKDFSKQFSQFLGQNDIQVTVFEKAFEDTDSKFPLEVLQNAYEYFVQTKLDPTELLYLVFHAHIHKEQCYNKPINRNYNEVKQFALQQINEETIKTIKGFSEFYKDIDNQYAKIFQERHFKITPFTKEQLTEYCEQRKIDQSTILFDPHSGLCQNACMSITCPFFLQVRQKFKLHLDSWQGKLPLGFHRFVKARLNLNPEEIFEKCKTKWKNFPQHYNVNKEFVIDYAKNLLQAYALVK